MGDDSIPADRLGELLRAARKHRGFTRKQAAAMVRVTVNELRAYERGEETAPAEVCARFSECYGVEIIPARVPLEFDTALHRDDDVTRVFVELVKQLRRTKRGEALRFRSDDLAALASALESDAETIEQRIMATLGCSRDEAAALRHELLRRKIVLPVAGLAAGLAAFAGMQAASAHEASHGPVVAPPTTEITAAPSTTTTTTIPPTTTTTTIAPRPVVSTPRTAPPVVHATAPVTAAPHDTTDVTRPVISTNDTVPEGVLPGEHPLAPPTTTP